MEQWEIEKEVRHYLETLKDAKYYLKQITDNMIVIDGLDKSTKEGEKNGIYAVKQPFNGYSMYCVFSLIENKYGRKEWLKFNSFGPYDLITNENYVSSVVYNFSKNDFPSFVYHKGYLEWTNEKEQWHRIDKPAMIKPDTFIWMENHKEIKREKRIKLAPEFEYVNPSNIPSNFPINF